MLKTGGDAQYRFLDLHEAEPGDRFFRLRHEPYSDTVTAIEAVEVLQVEDKFLRCRSDGEEKVWKLRRHDAQIHCYVAEDPLFQQFYYTFTQTKRIQQAKDGIRRAAPEQYDETILLAIEAWQKRI